MKQWNLSDELRADAAASARVGQLRPVVEEILGKSGPHVEASWGVGGAVGGRRSLVLRLADWTYPQGVDEEFTDDELAPSTATRWKLNHMWGRLLQARSHRLLADLLKAE